MTSWQDLKAFQNPPPQMVGAYWAAQRYSGAQCPGGPAASLRSQLTYEEDEAPGWRQEHDELYFVDDWGFKSSCELVWELYLKELTGSLSKVADDAFQGFALRLIGNCIQIYCTCRGAKQEIRVSKNT